jgi:hypothetical protein
VIIEVDEYKKKAENYDANNSELFHSESGKLADADFIACLKSKKYKRIIFMAGGTASGKTEFAYSYLNKKDQLVYDGTLKSTEGFKVKRDRIKKHDKNNSRIKVVLIIPKDWIKAFETFLTRERKMKPEIFFDTHVKSLLSVSKILNTTKVKVEIYISNVEDHKDKLGYKRFSFKKIGKRKNVAKTLEIIANTLQEVAVSNGFEVKF